MFVYVSIGMQSCMTCLTRSGSGERVHARLDPCCGQAHCDKFLITGSWLSSLRGMMQVVDGNPKVVQMTGFTNVAGRQAAHRIVPAMLLDMRGQVA